MGEKNIKNKNLILIILIIILGLTVVGLSIYIINNKRENDKQTIESTPINSNFTQYESDVSAELKENCVNVYDIISKNTEDMYDYYSVSSEISFNKIKLDGIYNKLSYTRDLTKRVWTAYLNKTKVIEKELEDTVLTKLCIYNDKIMISHNWEGLDNNHIINSSGKVIYEFKGDYEYTNNKLKVYTYDYDNSNLKTYNLDLSKDEIKEEDVVSSSIKCSEIDINSEPETKEEIYKYQYCHGI